MLAATKPLSNKRVFVATSTLLSRQRTCFVATKDVFCRDKRVFVAKKVSLTRQKYGAALKKTKKTRGGGGGGGGGGRSCLKYHFSRDKRFVATSIHFATNTFDENDTCGNSRQ